MADQILSADHLRRVLDYNPETGVFVWKSRSFGKRFAAWNARFAGTVAGSPNSEGYITIYVENRPYKAHRLAWLYVHGAWPQTILDHKDGNTSNNKIRNLREASDLLNAQNVRAARRDNQSTGLLGVSYVKRNGKFAAQISVRGKQLWLGYHQTAEQAYDAYLAAKRKYHAGCTI